jgi:hypothetical protein
MVSRFYFTVSAEEELLLLAHAQKIGELVPTDNMTRVDRERAIHNAVTSLIARKCAKIKRGLESGDEGTKENGR